MTIDWNQLGRQIGSVHDRGELGGDEVGRLALCEILGQEFIEQSVETYVAGSPGAAVARSVLNILQSDYAVSRCLEIYQRELSLDRRRAAVELLRGFASRSLLEWARAFISDPDYGIASWGMSLVDHLVFAGEVLAAEAEPLIQMGEAHPDEQVRETARRIREYLTLTN